MDALIAPLWMGISLFWLGLLAWRWNRFPEGDAA